MLLLSLTGRLHWLVRVIPLCVVRGVQLGLALSLGQLALKQYVPAMGAPGYALAAASFVVVALLFGNRRLPAALPVIGLGVVVALISGIDTSAIAAGSGSSFPRRACPRGRT
jgi:xanthine/uracil/vitamin C permease (AzgA family)